MKIAAIIVDDEGPDRELLKSLIGSYCQYLHVVDEANSVATAEKLIVKHQPKVVFLDIQMHTQQGFELLEKFPERKFLAVMTTGYDQYGIQAVKAGAFDYLLKPIDVDELVETEQKIARELQRVSTDAEDVLKLFNQGEQLVIKVSEVMFLKAQGSYTLVTLADGRDVLAAKNLNEVMTDVRGNQLVRVHRSYAVNLHFVKSYQPTGNEGIVTLLNDVQLRISRSYKPLLKSLLP
jgi:two-component system, LytTR family, response regulator